MKSAAKEKIRSSGPTRSYLQTRVRASRLLATAHILALVELSRRLHQAYEQAYDKQAADWLLPQDPGRVLFDFATLNDCTEKLFGVTVSSFTPSNRGSNGSFTGFGPDTIRNGGNNANITVTNDVNRYSSRQSLAIVNASFIANGQRPLPANTFIYGFTDSSSPYTNFTSNNVRNTVEIVKTQIHELGNSLRYITGAANNDRARVPDPDAGNRLENCVFKTRR